SFLRLDPKTLGLALLGSALGAVLLAVKRHGIPVALGNALLLTMGTLAPYWVALWALSSLHATPDASVAAGWQAFFGRPKAVDLAAMNLFMAVGCATALLAIVLLRQWRRAPSAGEDASRSSARWTSGDTAFLVACLVVVALASLPATVRTYTDALAGHRPLDFDNQNVFTWEYLSSAGQVP